MTQENELKEIVEVEVSRCFDIDILEDPRCTQIVDLDTTAGEDAATLKIKSPCTLLISTSEWAQVYIVKED